jgi:histone acetyltransferase
MSSSEEDNPDNNSPSDKDDGRNRISTNQGDEEKDGGEEDAGGTDNRKGKNSAKRKAGKINRDGPDDADGGGGKEYEKDHDNVAQEEDEDEIDGIPKKKQKRHDEKKDDDDDGTSNRRNGHNDDVMSNDVATAAATATRDESPPQVEDREETEKYAESKKDEESPDEKGERKSTSGMDVETQQDSDDDKAEEKSAKVAAVGQSQEDDNKAKNELSSSSSATAEEKEAETASSTAVKKKESATDSNPYDSIKYTIVKNDGRPESLIKLVALKSLFSKQLPKMPRAYIARLVFDRRHISLAILNQDPATRDTDEEVIGAICYRPFNDMKFAEIAFCAVNASHQVKGYGTKLMNLVKQEGARSGIEYFITYADNYAIGYFKKQGFSKSISMPKGRFQHLIKDYDGGTMMECYVHPSIDFTRVREMIEAQRQFVLSRIRLKANSTRVYDALPADWTPEVEVVSRGNELAARAMAIPGMTEAGWTMTDLQMATGQGKDADKAKSALKSEMLSIVRKIEEQQFAWPFREPVDTDEVKDYLDVIKEPIDLSTIEKRIRKGDYYKSKKMLYTDLTLLVNNCKLYNEEESTYVQCAVKLENYLTQLFAD